MKKEKEPDTTKHIMEFLKSATKWKLILAAECGVIKARELPANHCLQYRIRGINPKTGRKNTVRIIAGTWENIYDVAASRSGLLSPYEISDETPAATEAQIQYMVNLNIKFPDGISKWDASVLLQHAEDGKDVFNDPLSMPILSFAVNHNVYVSSFLTVTEAKNILISNFPELKKEIKEL